MFKTYSAIFIIFVLLLQQSLTMRIKFSSLKTSLAPSNSFRDILVQLLQDAKDSDTSNPTSFKDFLVKVKSMITSLKDNQEKHKEVHAKMSSQCKEEVKFRDQESSDAKDAMERSNEARAKCDESLSFAKKDILDLDVTISNYEAEVTRAKNQRKYENKIYLDRKTDLEAAIGFVKDFQTFLLESYSVSPDNASFIDMSEGLLKHMSSTGSLSETIPILIAISQVATTTSTATPVTNAKSENKSITTTTTVSKLDDSVMDDLKSTVSRLIKRLQASWSTNEEAETSNIIANTQYTAKLAALLNKLATSKKVANTQVMDMTLCVTKEDAISVQASDKFTRNNRLKVSAMDMCKKFDLEFVLATKDRLEEVTMVEEVLEILNDRFKQRSLDLEQYLEEVKAGWTVYVNSTEFKEFVEYSQTHTERTKEGEALAKKDADKDEKAAQEQEKLEHDPAKNLPEIIKAPAAAPAGSTSAPAVPVVTLSKVAPTTEHLKTVVDADTGEVKRHHHM